MDTGFLPDTVLITKLDDYVFEIDAATQMLLEHFKVVSLEGYGCAGLPLAIRAAGAAVHYIAETQKSVLGQIDSLSTYSTESFMTIDTQTRRNLELFSSTRWGTATSSLLSIIDGTKTSMGGRLIRKWLGQPLLDIKILLNRQDHINWFYKNNLIRQQIIALLGNVGDLERLVNRVRNGVAIPRDLIALSASLEKLAEVKAVLEAHAALTILAAGLKPCPDVVHLIRQAITEAPGSTLEHGNVIKSGFSAELDNLRQSSSQAKNYLANLERQEKEKTGIKSLKVGYNRVFGYYIEISNANLNLVPGNYIRKQTLTNGERFFTPELKEYESVILNAQERILELEAAIFRQICQQIAIAGEQIISSARTLAEIDVYCSLAEVAVNNRYMRPELNESNTIVMKNGRHPVVERGSNNEGFVPNDTYLGNEDVQLIILTGPNMSGKSTYLKQVALIVLLAQIGSFVPADSASIGIVDRIFTRIGAQEDLAAGQSTFMVEMVETVNILNNATSRSLIILDEVGRGTSTYDGLSIAWAVVEFIHNSPRLKSKTLFATHYHELIELAHFLPRVNNLNVAVSEEGGKVVFLRKVIPGGADKSYGIHVAQLAGLPSSVVHRAQEVLARLENIQFSQRGNEPSYDQNIIVSQLSMFNEDSKLADEIIRMDIDSLSPLEALNKLYELKKKARENKEI